MKILIAGGGRLGEQAAHVLTATGHQVTVIERDKPRIAELGGEHLHGLVHGDACEPSTLEHAGALNTAMLLASTGEDEDNLVIALLAKRQFHVPRVLARVNDPDNTWLFDHRWGVDIALPAAAPLISLIEEAAGITDTIGLVRLAEAGVTLIETHIRPESGAANHTLLDVPLPRGTVVATIIHHGQPIIPTPDYRYQVGDTILVITNTATEHDIHNTFQ